MQELQQIPQDQRIDTSRVKGWAIDADPENDPTYPMKNRTDVDHLGYSWARPAQQDDNVEVLHSNERPNLAATFGVAAPPTGLSGMIRRRAFDYSENSYGHWLPLMLADRVDMVEGLFADLASGHIPNILGERGLKADWKYDRTRLLTKVAIGAAAVGVLAYFMQKGRREEA